MSEDKDPGWIHGKKLEPDDTFHLNRQFSRNLSATCANLSSRLQSCRACMSGNTVQKNEDNKLVSLLNTASNFSKRKNCFIGMSCHRWKIPKMLASISPNMKPFNLLSETLKFASEMYGYKVDYTSSTAPTKRSISSTTKDNAAVPQVVTSVQITNVGSSISKKRKNKQKKERYKQKKKMQKQQALQEKKNKQEQREKAALEAKIQEQLQEVNEEDSQDGYSCTIPESILSDPEKEENKYCDAECQTTETKDHNVHKSTQTKALPVASLKKKKKKKRHAPIGCKQSKIVFEETSTTNEPPEIAASTSGQLQFTFDAHKKIRTMELLLGFTKRHVLFEKMLAHCQKHAYSQLQQVVSSLGKYKFRLEHTPAAYSQVQAWAYLQNKVICRLDEHQAKIALYLSQIQEVFKPKPVCDAEEDSSSATKDDSAVMVPKIEPVISNNKTSKSLYMVIDLEAVVINKSCMPNRSYDRYTPPELDFIIEQAAYILVNEKCEVVLMGKFRIHQPMTLNEMTKYFNKDIDIVRKALNGYIECTMDSNFIHDTTDCVTWIEAKEHIQKISNTMASKTFAKGALLEQTAFGDAIHFEDLNYYNCAKYPYRPHDPFDECRFFAMFIPYLKEPNLYRQHAYMEIQNARFYRKNMIPQEEMEFIPPQPQPRPTVSSSQFYP